MKRYLLYHSFAKSTQGEIESNYTIKEISVCCKNRSFLSKSDYLWNLISFGRLRKIIILNNENRMIHTSLLLGKCFKFPFLSKTSAEIGPCFTDEDFRGRGIYPMALKYILNNCGYQEYYMIVSEKNISSIKGIEKAGFQRCGFIRKSKLLKRYHREETAHDT